MSRQSTQSPELSTGRLELLELLSREQQRGEAPPLVPLAAGSERPLSFLQERMWISEKLAGPTAAGIYAGLVILRGLLDVEALTRAFVEVFRRHEVTRTSFPGKDTPTLEIHGDVQPELTVLDLSQLGPEARDAAVREITEAEARRDFDLARWPLCSLTLVKLAEQEHMLLSSAHHIILDGWSAGLIRHELATLYKAFAEARPSPLPELPVQYSDYAAWQREWATRPEIQNHLEYWKRQLGGQIPYPELPTDRPRSAVRSFRSASYSFTIPGGLLRSIKKLGIDVGTTPFMTLLAAFTALLNRCSGQEDIAVGSPISNRRRREVENLIGCFMQPLVLRVDLSGDPSFAELLDRVRHTCLNAYAHQDAPFELVARASKQDWDAEHAPLFQVLFNVQRGSGDYLELRGIEIEAKDPPRVPSSALDLSLNLWLDEGQASGLVEYRAELFEEATIAWLIRCFLSMLGSIVADPSRRISAIPISGRVDGGSAPFVRQATGISDKRRELLELLDSEANRLSPAPSTSPGLDGKYIPCSFGQERLWFVDRQDPDSPFYNESETLEFRGPLDLETLKRSIGEVIARHDILRTGFRLIDGRPMQFVAPNLALDLPLLELTGLSPKLQNERTRSLLEKQTERPFDLTRPGLWRAVLVRYGPGHHLLCITSHHLITDGLSGKVLRTDLAAVYKALSSGQPSPLAPLPMQYADFALGQRRWYREAIVQGQLAYWKRRLAGELPWLDLPRRPQKAQSAASARKQTLTFDLPQRLGQALAGFSRELGATPFMVLFSAFCVLLYRYTGQEDLLIDSPTSGRNRRELEGLIGFFVNSLALRADLSGQPTFRELVARVRSLCLEAYANQDLPFDKVVPHLHIPSERRGKPLSPVSFMLRETLSKVEPFADGISVSPGPFDIDDDSELTMVLRQEEQSFFADLQFDSGLLDAATAQRLGASFQTLVSSILDDIDQMISELPILPPEERTQLLTGFNPAEVEPPAGVALHQLLEEQAERTPHAVAVVVPGSASESWAREQRLSYAQLNQRANQIARHLAGKGVGPESRVGICLERTPDLVTAVWGVLKTGAAYVPLDLSYGVERVKFMLEDSSATLVVTHRGLVDSSLGVGVQVVDLDLEAEAIGSQPSTNLGAAVDPEQLAYLIYTSGSTGRPKGVMVTQRSLMVTYHAWAQSYRLKSLSRHLQMASFSFDVFVGDLVRALCSGAALVLCPRESLLQPEELAGIIERYAIDCGEFVPAVIRPLMEHLEQSRVSLKSLKLVVVGSDLWYGSEYHQLSQLLGPEVRLVNSYGVTEATIDNLYYERREGELAAEAPVPIGLPYPNCRIYLLDPYLNLVPQGAAGELYLGGSAVARGYAGRPDLSAERFVPDPFGEAGQRLYRTGDRARFLPDGNLAFLGRADHQIKIRGFRIEPGEIEAVLEQHPAVEQAVVIARADEPGARRLVAYVVGPELVSGVTNGSGGIGPGPRGAEPAAGPAKDKVPAEEAQPTRELVAGLRSYLRGQLPDHMVPSAIVLLGAMPLGPNGKLDRRALPAPQDSMEAGGGFMPLETDTQRRVAAVWSEVLGVDQVGLNDNFFDLGGHSLLLFAIQNKVNDELGTSLTLADLFEHNTVDALSRHIDLTLWASGPADEVEGDAWNEGLEEFTI